MNERTGDNPDSSDQAALESRSTEELLNEMESRLAEYRRRLGVAAKPEMPADDCLTPTTMRQIAADLLQEAVLREAVLLPEQVGTDFPPDPPEVSPKGLRTFMCEECGTETESKAKGNRRRLKCTACGRATEHLTGGWQPDRRPDWREQQNAKANTAVLLRHAAWLEGTYRELGIKLDQFNDECDWEKYSAEIVRSYGGRTDWLMDINPGVTLTRRVQLLQAGLRSIGVDVQYWADPDVYRTRTDDVRQHIRRWPLQPGDTVDEALAQVRRQ